jgi:hypothetical protein
MHMGEPAEPAALSLHHFKARAKWNYAFPRWKDTAEEMCFIAIFCELLMNIACRIQARV